MAKKAKKGLPPWMATFADLSTLLLTFFVLLLTFANMDLKKFQDMLGSVQRAFGVQTHVKGQFQPVMPKPSKPQEEQKESFRSKESQDDAPGTAQNAAMARQVQQMVNGEGLGKQVELTSGPDGVRMRVKGALLFTAGESEVLRGADKLLRSVAMVMDRFDYYLTVEGHTDDQPIHTDRYPSNWELSASRASAVLRYLAKLGVPPTRMTAVGYASNYPISPNTNEQGRIRNRRVEFVFTKRPLRVGVD